MAEINYLDFDLLLERSGTGYRARVSVVPPSRRPATSPCLSPTWSSKTSS